MKRTQQQVKALELLKQLGELLSGDPTPTKQKKLLRKLENSLTFKDQETHNKWLDCLFSYRCYEDFEELTKAIIKDMKSDLVKNILELKKIMSKVKDKRVYARVTYVSASGMSRGVTFRVITKKGELLRIDNLIRKITSYRWAREWDNGIVIGGCGMDVIFNTLYNINSIAMHQGITRTSMTRTDHDLLYNGIVNTNYWTL